MGISAYPPPSTPSRERTLSMDVIPFTRELFSTQQSSNIPTSDPYYVQQGKTAPLHSNGKLFIVGANTVKIINGETLQLVNTATYGITTNSVHGVFKLEDDLVIIVWYLSGTQKIMQLYKISTNTFGAQATVTQSDTITFATFDANTQHVYFASYYYSDPDYIFATRKYLINRAALTVGTTIVGTAIGGGAMYPSTTASNGKIYQHVTNTALREFGSMDLANGYGVTSAYTKSISTTNQYGLYTPSVFGTDGAIVGNTTSGPNWNAMAQDFGQVYGNYFECYLGLIPMCFDLVSNILVFNRYAAVLNNTAFSEQQYSRGGGYRGNIINWNGSRYFVSYVYNPSYQAGVGDSAFGMSYPFSQLYITKMMADGTTRTKMFPIQARTNMSLNSGQRDSLSLAYSYVSSGKAFFNAIILAPTYSSYNHSFLERLEIGSLLDEVAVLT